MLNPVEHAALIAVDQIWERAMKEKFFQEPLYHAHADCVRTLERYGYSPAFLSRLREQQLDILSKPDAGPVTPTKFVEDNGDKVECW